MILFALISFLSWCNDFLFINKDFGSVCLCSENSFQHLSLSMMFGKSFGINFSKLCRKLCLYVKAFCLLQRGRLRERDVRPAVRNSEMVKSHTNPQFNETFAPFSVWYQFGETIGERKSGFFYPIQIWCSIWEQSKSFIKLRIHMRFHHFTVR